MSRARRKDPKPNFSARAHPLSDWALRELRKLGFGRGFGRGGVAIIQISNCLGKYKGSRSAFASFGKKQGQHGLRKRGGERSPIRAVKVAIRDLSMIFDAHFPNASPLSKRRLEFIRVCLEDVHRDDADVDIKEQLRKLVRVWRAGANRDKAIEQIAEAAESARASTEHWEPPEAASRKTVNVAAEAERIHYRAIELAEMTSEQYTQARESAAKSLKISVQVLDKRVQEIRETTKT
jgi:hypothetical protein